MHAPCVFLTSLTPTNKICREYPVADDRNGNAYDYLSFTAWMESLKASLGDKGLSVTLPSSYWYMQHFDITHLEKHVDWFNVSLTGFSNEWIDTNPT